MYSQNFTIMLAEMSVTPDTSLPFNNPYNQADVHVILT